MIELKIPKIKPGDVISFDYEGVHHIAFCYQETSTDGIRLVSLNHKKSVWKDVDKWWNTITERKIHITNIQVMEKGEVLNVS